MPVVYQPIELKFIQDLFNRFFSGAFYCHNRGVKFYVGTIEIVLWLDLDGQFPTLKIRPLLGRKQVELTSCSLYRFAEGMNFLHTQTYRDLDDLVEHLSYEPLVSSLDSKVLSLVETDFEAWFREHVEDAGILEEVLKEKAPLMGLRYLHHGRDKFSVWLRPLDKLYDPIPMFEIDPSNHLLLSKDHPHVVISKSLSQNYKNVTLYKTLMKRYLEELEKSPFVTLDSSYRLRHLSLVI